MKNRPQYYSPHRERIAGEIEADILAGRYAPGARLTEREIVTRFKVSSIPAREALQELEGRGLVVKRPNAGCSVVSLTPDEVKMLCRVRRWLEPKVVQWSVRRMTPELLAEARAHLEALRQSAERNDRPGFFREDVLFHRAIWMACGVPQVVRSLEITLAPLFVKGLAYINSGRNLDLPAEAEKHARILAAVERGDAQGAARMVQTLARDFEKALRRR